MPVEEPLKLEESRKDSAEDPADIRVPRCVQCRKRRLSVARVVSLGLYEGSLKEAVRAFKFSYDPSLALYFAQLLAQRLANLDLDECDAIAYVPASRERLARFGFDQARLLALQLSRVSGIPLVRAVRRRGWLFDPGRQTALGWDEREMAVKHKFIVSRRALEAAGRRDEGKPFVSGLAGEAVGSPDQGQSVGAARGVEAAVRHREGHGVAIDEVVSREPGWERIAHSGVGTQSGRGEPPARVLLVDDVVTTGSTINGIARLLKNAGVQEVVAVVVAVTPPKRGGVRIGRA
jgi:predicted amidophosphoribosyltransferase